MAVKVLILSPVALHKAFDKQQAQGDDYCLSFK